MTAINWTMVNSDLRESHVEGRHVEILKVQGDCHGYHYNVIVDGQCDESEDTLALAREAVERMAAKWAAPKMTTTNLTYKERIEKAASCLSEAAAILYDLQSDWEFARERRDAAGQEPSEDDPMDESISTLTDWAIEAENLESELSPEIADAFYGND